MRVRSTVPIALGGAALILAGALSPALAKGPGDPESKVTLPLLVQDAPGRQSEDAVNDLVALSSEIGDGIISFATTWDGGDVIDAVRTGAAALGMVPARDADAAGVTSLDVLEAPFLIDNDALAVAVATSDIARDALAGFDAIGVTGLSMWPEDLRHLYAFNPSGRVFRTPDDLKDADVLVVTGQPGRDLITGLGGRIYQENTITSDQTGAREADAMSGMLEGMVTGLKGAGLPIQDATVAGDLVLYSKYQMLLGNNETLAGLTEHQREVLDQIVAEAQQRALKRHYPEPDLAVERCGEGATVITLGPDAVAAFEAAAQPLLDRLAADPVTGDLIARVQALKDATPRSPAADSCTPASVLEASAPPEPTGASELPAAGIWRTFRTRDDMVAKGASDHTLLLFADRSVELTFDGGRWSGFSECGGDYHLQNGYLLMDYELNHAECGTPDVVLQWRATGPDTAEVTASPSSVTDDKAIFSGTWTRVADAPILHGFIGDELPPDGTYRATMGLEELQAAGMARDDAGLNAGVWDWTFHDGAWSASHNRESCSGSAWVDGGAVHADERVDHGCGMEYIFRWRPVENGIEVLGLGVTGFDQLTEQQATELRAFVRRVWSRVGEGPSASPSAAAAWVTDRLPPDGGYRVVLDRQDLLDRGASATFASDNTGIWTWTLDGGTWTLGSEKANELCRGTYQLTDGAIDVADGGGGCSFAGRYQWREAPDGIELHVVSIPEAVPGTLQDNRAAIDRVWQRVQ